MFISVKRHEREKQDLIGASNRLTDAILKSSAQGLFLLDAKDKILPQVSASLAVLFRRQDFSNSSFEKLIAPLVTAKTLSVARAFMTRLFDGAPNVDAAQLAIRCRMSKCGSPMPTAHSRPRTTRFDFHAVDSGREPRAWLVRVTDITARVQQQRELEDLRTQMQTQGEILRSVLQAGGARFGAFLQRTDASMKTINGVLKKPAREADAFRSKLEETLDEVDRVRRDAAALKLTGLEAAARLLEDSLQELRSRGALSGSDFLPLAVKLDQLYGQFALLRSLSAQAGPIAEPDADTPETRMTENGTQIIEAPKFLAEMAQRAAAPHQVRVPRRIAWRRRAASTAPCTALTELVAQEHNKTVVLDCTGMRAGSAALSGHDQERRDSADPQRRHARRRNVRGARGRAASRRTAPCTSSSRPCRTRASSCISRTTAAASIRTRCAPPPSPAVCSPRMPRRGCAIVRPSN